MKNFYFLLDQEKKNSNTKILDLTIGSAIFLYSGVLEPAGGSLGLSRRLEKKSQDAGVLEPAGGSR